MMHDAHVQQQQKVTHVVHTVNRVASEGNPEYEQCR